VRDIFGRFILVGAPLLCCCIYFPCAIYSEWYIDELFAVLRNADARGESSLLQVFTNDFWGNPLGVKHWTHKSYRPLSVLSYALQFKLVGKDANGEGLFRPQPLRVFNVCLHMANTMLVLLLLRRGFHLSRRWSCLGACFFASHPVHVENVIYLVGRADALATLGWLLAVIVKLEVRNRKATVHRASVFSFCVFVLLSTVLAVMAGLCKESGLTLLVFLAGFELMDPHHTLATAACRALTLLTMFSVVAFFRFRVTQGTSAAFGFVDTPVQYHDSSQVRMWSYLFQHAFYGKLLVFPGNLSWDYSFDALPLMREGWRDHRALNVCTAYLALFAVAAWSLSGRGSRRVVLGIQSIIVPFVPASNLFFLVGVTIGERLLYPSTVGFTMAISTLGHNLEGCGHNATAKRAHRKSYVRYFPTAAGLLLLAVYCLRCGVRVWQWRSSEALFAADAAAWPGSVKTRHQLGTVYHAQDRYDEALREYHASLVVLDDNALTDHCIAQIYIQTGQYSKALEQFQKITSGHLVGFFRFNLCMLYVDYGFALVASNRFEEAIPLLKQGLDFNLAVPHGLNALGYSYAHTLHLQEAQDTFAKGLEYDPENPIIWSNLGALYITAGHGQPAAQALERALTIEPHHEAAIHNAMILKHGTNGMSSMPRYELFFSKPT